MVAVAVVADAAVVVVVAAAAVDVVAAQSELQFVVEIDSVGSEQG